MSAKKSYRYFMCDFETTVYQGQAHTEVWASACVELYSENVDIFHSLKELFDYLISLKSNVVAYFHNLKFDGAFWLHFLMVDMAFKQAYRVIGKNEWDVEWLDEKDMKSNTFKYSISDRGQWYTILIKKGKHFIEIRDSLKLLPFSVRQIGESFGTKHKKLDMEYKGVRYAGCEIKPQEKDYIANDVLVPKEALEIMFNEGQDKLTIGACCLSEYKRICKSSIKNIFTYDEMFPNLYLNYLDEKKYKYKTQGHWIRRSYRGGWCYLVKGKEGKIYSKGITADVNSLYPSMMYSESGNYYPIGKPCFWSGNFIPDAALKEGRYYFVRIKTRFYIKEGMLPFIQIKNSLLYDGTECLESTDVKMYDRYKKEWVEYTSYTDIEGNLQDTRVELTLTMTDFTLLKEHYELVDFEILDGCWFYAQIGIFDEYIDKYKEKKLNTTGALKELAKLFLNNLYGKMASSTDSSFKLAKLKENGTIGFIPVHEEDKTPGYIPVGSAITSYARNFTIRAAQKNYYGKDNPGFIYADTDSIHCDIEPGELKGIQVHDKDFCCWKLESTWDEAIFTRQKTYIEHVIESNLKPLDEPYYNVKCAGMPDKCKDLFVLSMHGDADINNEWSEQEKKFLFDEEGKPIVRGLKDFTVGLKVPGKLIPKRIPGGIVLVDDFYTMQ